jgi:prepilin-type N-terminal cleavage/methylation domain-containing protein
VTHPEPAAQGREGGRRREAGVTLIELMVGVIILSVLAAIALPAFTRDSLESRFWGYVNRFARDVQRCHTEAISSKEDRSLVLTAADRYTINSIVVTSSGSTAALLNQRQAPGDVVSTGFLALAAVPWNTSYSSQPSFVASKELRFKATGSVATDASGTLTDSAATVFFKTTNDRIKARVVIFQATSLTKIYEGW